MKINVYSLKRANELILSDINLQKNWISIRDVGYPEIYKYIRSICKNVCVIEFDDVTHYQVEHNLLHPYFNKIMENRDLIYFNEEHAKQIINFAKHVFDSGEELNIHCYAGKSRSQAVGYVLNQYFNLYLTQNLEDYKRNICYNNEKFMANSEVIKVFNKVLFGGN